jgi:hypothetical protein
LSVSSRLHLFLLLLLTVPILIPACAKETKPPPKHGNYAPEILTIGWTPSIAHPWEEVQVFCTTRDEDRDNVTYRWNASAGGFPSGDEQQFVQFHTPPSFSAVQIWVTVSDGKDTARRDTTITLSGIVPPPRLEFINSPNLVDLQWTQSPDEHLEGFQGYEIYVAPRSVEGLPDDSLPKYRLTTEPIPRTHYRVTPVPAGVRRFYNVRSRRQFPAVTEQSKTGAEIETAVAVYGFGDALYEIGSSSTRKGVRLSTGRQFAIDDPAVRDSIDFYLGTQDPEDRAVSRRPPYLKSPSLLAYRDAGWTARITQFQRLGRDWTVSLPSASAPWTMSDSVAVGDVFAVRTSEGHYGKVQILEMYASPPNRYVQFQWAWQPIPQYERF